MDITDPASVERAIVRYKPWAIVNASGYVRVDDAERELERCMRENAIGPTDPGLACARHASHLTFSSDLVFDGAQDRPMSKRSGRAAERVRPQQGRGRARVLDKHPQALVVRTSAFFGPWDEHNFVTQALQAWARRPFAAASDMTVSPTYVPDLVHACLDLLIDGEAGIWHLTNGAAMSWADLARRAAPRPASTRPAWKRGRPSSWACGAASAQQRAGQRARPDPACFRRRPGALPARARTGRRRHAARKGGALRQLMLG
jgi:dTDP-4-dehydrorhamnose reductase